MEKDLVFLHIPHTAGRVIKRYFWINNKKVINIHNQNDFKLIKDKKENIRKYFILRNPIERIIAEYNHYSRNLSNIGIVNYLDIKDILNRVKDFNVNNISDYIKLEITRNLYCKFLLHRENFWDPVTDKDFDEIKTLVANREFEFDYYKNPIELRNLSKLIGMEECELNNKVSEITKQCQVIRKEDTIQKQEYLNNELLVKEIERLNMYDMMLYDYFNS